VDAFDNPIGTDGFEFVAYTASDPEASRSLFQVKGFLAIARYRPRDVAPHRQGDINFITNVERGSFAQGFARQHGPL